LSSTCIMQKISLLAANETDKHEFKSDRVKFHLCFIRVIGGRVKDFAEQNNLK